MSDRPTARTICAGAWLDTRYDPVTGVLVALHPDGVLLDWCLVAQSRRPQHDIGLWVHATQGYGQIVATLAGQRRSYLLWNSEHALVAFEALVAWAASGGLAPSDWELHELAFHDFAPAVREGRA